MSKEKIKRSIIVISLLLILFITPFNPQTVLAYKQVNHEEVGTSRLQNGLIEVFYTSDSLVQKDLAEQCLDIIYEEYKICSEIMNLSIDELNPCSLVFCDSVNDPYVTECKWFSYVDEVQCWPIIGETNLSFESPINVWMLYHLLPHEIADTTLRVRNVDPTYGGWFIEGIGEYAKLTCAEKLNKLNESSWLNYVRNDLNDLSSQKYRIVDLSNRNSFKDYAGPESEDKSVFYVGSLVYIYDLVEKYGDQFISDVVANNCTSYQEIRNVIKESTGYDIEDSIKNVTVGWILEEYISLLEEFNVNISELQQLKKIRGIAVGSDIVGDESEISDIISFIDDCNINMLVVDFGWITWSWNHTNFDDVSIFINESKQREIPTWLMYRARTLEGEYEHLQHQISKTGEVDSRNICFSNNKSRKWSINWAHKLLEKYPSVDGIILYNPYYSSNACYCTSCLEKFKNHTGIIENPVDFEIGTTENNKWLNWKKEELAGFINEWKNDMSSFYPDLKFGLVLNSNEYANILAQNISQLGKIVDIICPFTALDSVTDDDFSGKICNDVKEITNATVIADIKIYGPYKNDDTDIINAMKSVLESNGDGFFIWCYDQLYSTKYDLESIKKSYNYYYESEINTEDDENNYSSNTEDSNIIFYIFAIIITLLISVILLLIILQIRKRKKVLMPKKLVILLTVMIIVAAIAAGLFFSFQDKENENPFIGTWEVSSGSSIDNATYFSFYKNNTYSTNYGVSQGLLWENYKIEKGKINITNPDISVLPSFLVFEYEFSKNGTNLNLYYEGFTIVLTKAIDEDANTFEFETGDNILQNSGFEEGLGDEPEYWSKAVIPAEKLKMSWDNETKYSRNKSVSINNSHIYDDQVSNNWFQRIQNIPVGRTVELSGWVKTINAENVVMVIQCLDKEYNFLGFGTTQTKNNITGTKDWQMYNASVYIPDETDKLSVALALTGTGQVWFDDVKLIIK